MKPIDRFIFFMIALGLLLNAWAPHFVRADRLQAVDIRAVGGKALSFGEGIPTR